MLARGIVTCQRRPIDARSMPKRAVRGHDRGACAGTERPASPRATVLGRDPIDACGFGAAASAPARPSIATTSVAGIETHAAAIDIAMSCEFRLDGVGPVPPASRPGRNGAPPQGAVDDVPGREVAAHASRLSRSYSVLVPWCLVPSAVPGAECWCECLVPGAWVPGAWVPGAWGQGARAKCQTSKAGGRRFRAPCTAPGTRHLSTCTWHRHAAPASVPLNARTWRPAVVPHSSRRDAALRLVTVRAFTETHRLHASWVRRLGRRVSNVVVWDSA